MLFKGLNNMFTCDWQQSVFIPDLEENKISAVLCISKNRKPKVTLETYTSVGIQHYSASIDELPDDKLEAEANRIAKIIDWFVSKDLRILIHSSEECAVPFAMIFYLIWTYYHNSDGTLKANIKKPDYSIASRATHELTLEGIETNLLQSMVQKLYKLENKYAGLG